MLNCVPILQSGHPQQVIDDVCELALQIPKPTQASGQANLAFVLFTVIRCGFVPMVYLRPNLDSYDATYLLEHDSLKTPYARDAALNDATVFVPIVWQLRIEELPLVLDMLSGFQRRNITAAQLYGARNPDNGNFFEMETAAADWIAHNQLATNPAPFENRDLTMLMNDCIYYFPEFDFEQFGDAFVGVNLLQPRPLPGSYVMPFGEGIYRVMPKLGARDALEYETTYLPRGCGRAYTHRMVRILDPTFVLSFGFIDFAQYCGKSRNLRARSVQSCFPEYGNRRDVATLPAAFSSSPIDGRTVQYHYTQSSPQLAYLRSKCGSDFEKKYASSQDFFSQWGAFDRLDVTGLSQGQLRQLIGQAYDVNAETTLAGVQLSFRQNARDVVAAHTMQYRAWGSYHEVPVIPLINPGDERVHRQAVPVHNYFYGVGPQAKDC